MSRHGAEALYEEIRSYKTFVDERNQAYVIIQESEGPRHLLLHGVPFRNHLRRIA